MNRSSASDSLIRSRDARPLLVVVVTWNSESVLPGLLASLPAGLDGVTSSNVLVVDNNSADRSRDIARAAGIKVINTGANLGYAAAVNIGLGEAEDQDHVLVLNPDVRLQLGAVAALLSELDTPGVGIVVPRIVDRDGRVLPSLRRRPTVARTWGEAILGGQRAARYPRLTEVVPVGESYEEPCDVEWATGAAVLVAASCRHELGNWDPTFFMYSEETEYMLRATQHRFRIRYTPLAVVEHKGGAMSTSPGLWQVAVTNRIGLYRRTHGPTRSLAFQAGLIVYEALRARSAVHRAGLKSAVRPSATAVHRVPGIVAFAGVDWWYHNRAHSDVQLVREIARERPVLMVNSIGLRMPLPGRSTQPLRRVARKARSMTRLLRTPDPDRPNFHVMTVLALPLYGNERLRERAARFTRWQVERAAHWYLMAEPHVLVTIPSADLVVSGMPRSSLTFNRSDLHSALPEADGPRIRAMERNLLVQSDLVLYVSHELMKVDAPLAGSRAHFLDHGADIDHFQRRTTWPDDIDRIPRPRIGFFGGIDDYIIDFDLLELIARRMPEASLVLIGDATCSMDRFSTFANVHLLGMRPYEEIPSYGSAFDVAIMPWLDNEWIRFCNPIKLKEYLALGLPVVSTDFPGVAAYQDVVNVAVDHEHFVELLRRALGQPRDPSAESSSRARVAEDTWAKKAQWLIATLDGLANQRSRQPTSEEL